MLENQCHPYIPSTTVLGDLGILTASHTFTALKGYNVHLSSNILIGLAFSQFVGLLFFKVAVRLNLGEMIGRIHNPHCTNENGDDDWELYEEAAHQREREAQLEREANLGGNIGKQSENASANSNTSMGCDDMYVY